MDRRMRSFLIRAGERQYVVQDTDRDAAISTLMQEVPSIQRVDYRDVIATVGVDCCDEAGVIASREV